MHRTPHAQTSVPVWEEEEGVGEEEEDNHTHDAASGYMKGMVEGGGRGGSNGIDGDALLTGSDKRRDTIAPPHATPHPSRLEETNSKERAEEG